VQKLFSSEALLWAGRGFWAVADQALFAGTNFLVSILLARWLEPAAYGAFSTAYALFLLLGTLHTGLWTEPMLVYGSGRFREAFSAYQALLIRYHWRFGLLVFVVFLVLGGLFWSLKGRELALSFLGLSVAAPAVLYLWLVRRGAYVHLNPRLAALGGGLYLFLFLGLAGFLFRAQLLNEATAFLAMALASALAAEAIRWRLRGRAPTQVAPSEVWALHWGYGRWALLAGALSWIPANLPLVALGGLKGLEAAGVFRAAYNLFMPVLHFQTALNALFFPSLPGCCTNKAKCMQGVGSQGWFLYTLRRRAPISCWGSSLVPWPNGSMEGAIRRWQACSSGCFPFLFLRPSPTRWRPGTVALSVPRRWPWPTGFRQG